MQRYSSKNTKSKFPGKHFSAITMVKPAQELHHRAISQLFSQFRRFLSPILRFALSHTADSRTQPRLRPVFLRGRRLSRQMREYVYSYNQGILAANIADLVTANFPNKN
jgi:hypothetical protein